MTANTLSILSNMIELTYRLLLKHQIGYGSRLMFREEKIVVD
jgi:hypothetical protein